MSIHTPYSIYTNSEICRGLALGGRSLGDGRSIAYCPQKGLRVGGRGGSAACGCTVKRGHVVSGMVGPGQVPLLGRTRYGLRGDNPQKHRLTPRTKGNKGGAEKGGPICGFLLFYILNIAVSALSMSMILLPSRRVRERKKGMHAKWSMKTAPKTSRTPGVLFVVSRISPPPPILLVHSLVGVCVLLLSLHALGLDGMMFCWLFLLFKACAPSTNLLS